jgi:hypothetical protein
MRPTRHIPKLIFAAAFLTCLLVMPGTVMPTGEAPTRLRVARWLWTGQSPEGLLPGRGGATHPWVGLGQSLVMLPADVAVALLTRGRDATEGQVTPSQFVLVSYLTFPLVNALAVLYGFMLLRRLGFGEGRAALGALSLLFLTTLLWHVQNNQDNPLQLLLVLAGLYHVLGWVETRSAASLAAASLALGFNLLVRLTTATDAACVLAVPLLVIYFGRDGGAGPRRREARDYLRAAALYAAPALALFLALDRLYHWHRFGTFSGTYMGLYGALRRAASPHFPADFPFNNDFLDGFTGPLVTSGKSVFIYDPLLVVALAAAALCWPRLSPRVKAVVACGCVMLLTTVGVYAKLFCWSGEAAWGNRYTTVPVHLLSLLALPLALSHAPRAGRWARPAALSLALAAALGLAFQLSSLVYPSWVEGVQAGILIPELDSRPTIPRQGEYCHVCMRATNIAADASGNFYEWGLDRTRDGKTIGPPTKRLVPFIPFSSLPPRYVALIKGAWWLLLLTLALVLALTYRAARGAKDSPAVN